MTRPEGCACRAALACALAAFAAGAQAQWPYGPAPQNPQWQGPAGQGQPGTQQPGQQPGQEPGRNPLQSPWGESSLDPEIYGVNDPFRLESVWMTPGVDVLQGFPLFPPNLSGYGGYPPAPKGLLQPPVLAPMPLPPAAPSAPDWPAWIKAKMPQPLPYDAATAVLVRQAERVWFRLPDEDAPSPLYHWDQARGLPSGSEVRVAQTGEFLLLFYGGARVASFGTCELKIGALAEKSAAIALSRFTRLQVTVFASAFACGLPDGSTLLVDAPPADAPAAGQVQLVIERIDDPGWFSGRATVLNTGDRPAHWRSSFGDVQLDPGRRLTMFLVPPRQALSMALVTEGVQVEADGNKRRWRAAPSGSVTWSGARFALPPGATLELDPLLGSVFDVAPSGGQVPPPRTP